MTQTAVWPIQVAVATLLQTIHPGQVRQEGELDPSDALPYDILGTATEPGDSVRSISQPGLDQTLQITFWATTKLLAHQRYIEAKAVLDHATLTLTGYGKSTRCVLSFVTDITDPPAEGNARGVVARLSTTTIQA